MDIDLAILNLDQEKPPPKASEDTKALAQISLEPGISVVRAPSEGMGYSTEHPHKQSERPDNGIDEEWKSLEPACWCMEGQAVMMR